MTAHKDVSQYITHTPTYLLIPPISSCLIILSASRFHHSSFVSGEAVQAAGLMVAHQGRLTKLYGHSGHYRPSEYNIYQLLMYLKARGIDMTHVEVDVQRMLRINRINDAGR